MGYSSTCCQMHYGFKGYLDNILSNLYLYVIPSLRELYMMLHDCPVVRISFCHPTLTVMYVPIPSILSFITHINYIKKWVREKRHKKWSMVMWYTNTCQGHTRYWNNHEDFWPCAGGLLAVNPIGAPRPDKFKTDPIVVEGTFGRLRGNRKESRE